MTVNSSKSAPALPESPADGQDSRILHPGPVNRRGPDKLTTITWSQPIGVIEPTRPVVSMDWHHVTVGPGGGGVALHQHHKDHAIWYVISGRGRADIGPAMGASQEEVGPGAIIDAPIGGYHYIENTGGEELVILEVIMRSADFDPDGLQIRPIEMETFDMSRYGTSKPLGTPRN